MGDSIESRIKEMIVERCFLDISPNQIGDQDDLMESLGLDSVQILEIVVGLEEGFGVSFEDSDFKMENFRTVAAIAEHVRRKSAV